MPYLKASDLSYHDGEKGVAGDVEWYTQTHISRSLIQLTRQLPVSYIKLY